MTRSFLFYDLETFGLDSRSDRIAQFAAVRVTPELEFAGDPILLYCRAAPDYLPSPSSCLVTGITPQTTLEDKPDRLCEKDFIERINAEMSVPGTCVLGYNTIGFDDEFIRNCLYRNLMDPYAREWRSGCSRWDVLDLVRAVHDFRPEGMAFPGPNEKGNPSFKLTGLTAANGISQENAHDALVDVNATVAVARLIKKTQPALFDFYFNHRSKTEANALLDTLTTKMVMYTCAAFTSPNGCSRPIAPVVGGAGKRQANAVWCLDLTQDPRSVLEASAAEVALAPAAVKVTTNRCPYLAPATIWTKVQSVRERLKIDIDEVNRNLEYVKANKSKFVRAFMGMEDKEPVADPDPELRIYADSFYSESDKRNMDRVNSLPPAEKLRQNIHFDSDKVHTLLFRQVARNWPEVLDRNGGKQWRSYCSQRLLKPFRKNPSITSYMREVSEKLGSSGVEPRDKITLIRLEEYGRKLYEDIFGEAFVMPEEEEGEGDV